MIAKIHSAIPCGYEGRIVEVEGDMNRGLPSFNIVGMANKTINESKERVRSALTNSEFSFPDRKVTINLAPAELQKDGTHLDLPIALAILTVSGQLQPQDTTGCLFVGELSLDGKIQPVRGIINIVEAAKTANFHTVYLPIKNLGQASLVSDIELIGVDTLRNLFLHLKRQFSLPKQSYPQPNVVKNTNTDTTSVLLDHIRGQALAKRALTIAVAGHHNILISGPPGAGKTMLARAAANLLPDLSPEEQIAITKIYSLANLTDGIITSRPFRAPHHTASVTSLIGGGAQANPGEISLAHHGVLFLDELPEYPRSVLESLRQPLEDKHITISRANQKSTYPADFMLIAAMNPCPCGYSGDPTHQCTCTPQELQSYRKKLSGPLFDRMDIHLTVPKVDNTDLFKTTPATNHEHNVVKNTITEAVQRQRQRYRTSILYNGSLSSHQISKFIHLDKPAEQLLHQASEKLNLSARSYFKIIKVAQTIADLEASNTVTEAHIAESLNFRQIPPCGL